MVTFKKLTKYVLDPDYRFAVNSKRGMFDHLPDEEYLKRKYRACLKKELNLQNPKTFNEKLQWLKLHDRKPIYTTMVDKCAVKQYVANKIGEECIIPTLGVWDTFDEIDFDKLPNQFVLKCTHDSGGLVICRSKENFDFAKAKKKIEKSLKRQFYYVGREWPYKNAPRKIIAEKYMEDATQENGLVDYKFYCFNGEPKLLYVSKGLENHNSASISFLNLDWSFAPFYRMDYNPFLSLPPKPQNYEIMIRFASELSKEIPFLRVDLYEIEGKVYFSELTFSPCSGFMPFSNPEWDEILGDWLTLPDIK